MHYLKKVSPNDIAKTIVFVVVDNAKMSTSLTKSYVSTIDPANPPQSDLVLHRIFDNVKKQGKSTELVNMHTGERTDTLTVLQKVKLDCCCRILVHMIGKFTVQTR